MTDETGIFSGLKVIDAANFIAAPAAAAIMADFEAEVIKVKAPGLGDPYRGVVATMDDVVADRQLRDSGALKPMPDPRAGATHIVDSPIWMEGVEKTPPVLAPTLGQHTVEVLRGAGYDDDEIDRLKESGAIA